ncbi:hypothetical protein PR002_g13799 [Phytophthora rubi]|uniref:Uncharacterized protein n=1 Tax=Phytophthora rubi TaxID=129364 RepID=A0A6A3LD22_9STRA|nr:hypothetical protein PR002_g13799 [Phytophthora rubi]
MLKQYQGQDDKFNEEQHNGRLVNRAGDVVHTPRSTATQEHFACGSSTMEEAPDVKKSFDKRLLTGWCDFEWDVDVATISDEFILKKIDKILSSVNNNSEPDEAALQIECRHGHESE